MKPLIMTKKQVKELLQITEVIYDNQIDTFLPVVSEFLVGSKGYLNNTFLVEGVADTTDQSIVLTNSTINNLEYGAVVKIAGVPSDAVVVDCDTDITLDQPATATSEGEDIAVRNFPYGYKDIVANMVWYKIGVQTQANEVSDGVKSEKIEDYSITFDDSWSIKGQGGYPMALLKGLDPVKKVRFF